MLAGLAVIPTIFALAPAPEAAVASGNTGLAFIHFPLWFVLIFSWRTWQAASWYPGEWYKWLLISKYTFSVGTMYCHSGPSASGSSSCSTTGSPKRRAFPPRSISTRLIAILKEE